MTIDMAWESLSSEEQTIIIGQIYAQFMYPHTRTCSCTAGNRCGYIQHIDDLLEAMTELAHEG